VSKNRYGSGKILMPDNSGILLPHRYGPGGGIWPASAAPAASRYDNSAAKLWYLMGEAASPFVNSGAGGVRDLAYDAGTSDGEVTYQVASIFPASFSAQPHTPHQSTKYFYQVDDTAWFGAAQTIWAWITLPDYSARNTPNWLWGRYSWWGAGQFTLRFDNTRKVSVEVRRVGGGTSTYSTADNAFTYGDPHLIAGTNDGNNTRIYVDGVDVGGGAFLANLESTATGCWTFGCELGQAKYDAIGVVHELGFDNSVFAPATLLAMYHAGVP
jgi:hypothetical protein